MQQEPSSNRTLLARLCGLLIASPALSEPTRPLVTLETRFPLAGLAERATEYKYQASPLQSSKSPAAANRLLLVIATAASLTLGTATVPNAQAAEITWTGGGSNNHWGNAANWDTLAAPPNNGTADIDFGAAGGFVTSHAEVAYSIRSLNFDSLASAYTITGAQITLGIGGLTQNALAGQLIQNAIFVGTSQTWRFGSNSGLLNLTGGVNLGPDPAYSHARRRRDEQHQRGVHRRERQAGEDRHRHSHLQRRRQFHSTRRSECRHARRRSGRVVFDDQFHDQRGRRDALKRHDQQPKQLFSGRWKCHDRGERHPRERRLIDHKLHLAFSTNGSFTQSGGTHVANSLVLEGPVATPGSYSLGGGTLTTNTTTVGFASNGAFTHSGGSHMATTLNLGNTATTGTAPTRKPAAR
jgi:hypothetical protein